MINIGKVVNKKLGKYVDKRCFPLVAELTTKKPFICYNRMSAYPQNSKDRLIYEIDHTLQINIVTDDYDEGISILQNVVNEFDDFEGEVSGIKIVNSKIADIADFYIDDAYVQQININIKTK